MQHRSRSLRTLLRSPLGRLQLLDDAIERSWPILRGVAGLYRRTLIRTSCLIAVVGSFGKSTTARAVVVALGAESHPRLLLNARPWVPLAVLRVRPGQQHGVLEVAVTGAGQMAKHARTVRPDIAVVTSVGSEHNRSFKTLEVTRAEKAEMVRILPASGWAVLNGDDHNVRWMADHTRARVMMFGFEQRNEVRATDMVLDWPHGTQFALHTPFGSRPVRVRLIGRPMVYAILAAVAVGLSQGLQLDQMLPGLESLEPTPGRLEPVPLANGAWLLRDDFKGALETIEVALDVLAEVSGKRRIVVLGDVSEPMGSSRPIYRRVGERVARVASRAIFVTGDNFHAYAAGAIRGGLRRSAIIHARGGVNEVINALVADLSPGDVILLKGRGGQRLERVVLALLGRTVRCELKHCAVRLTACHKCPMLERGRENQGVMV